MLEFCISDISHPLSSEIYLTLADDNIYLSTDTRIVKKLEVDGILNANAGLNVLGTITQGNLKLYEHNPTSATGSKGFIIHPSRLDFAISSSATPSTSEAYAVMAGNQIY